RTLGNAAVWTSAEAAGTMASKSGRASVTPAPFSTVLREICFLVMNMALLSKTQRHKGTKTQRKPAFKDRFLPVFFVPSCLCVFVFHKINGPCETPRY